MKLVHCCCGCGSTDVFADALAALNTDEVISYESYYCRTCERDCRTVEVEYETRQIILSENEDDVLWVQVPKGCAVFAADMPHSSVMPDFDTEIDFVYPEDRNAFLEAIEP